MIDLASLPPFDPRPVTLEGRFVRLEPLTPAHAGDLYEVLADPEGWRWVSLAAPRSAGDMEAHIRLLLGQQERGERIPWATRRRADGRIVGWTAYWAIAAADRAVEIGGTQVGAMARRSAVNTEAKYLQLRHGFEELGAIRVWLKTDARNERSQRAIERLGAKKEGLIRNERIIRGERVRDAYCYSVIRQEWPEVKAHLEDLLRR